MRVITSSEMDFIAGGVYKSGDAGWIGLPNDFWDQIASLFGGGDEIVVNARFSHSEIQTMNSEAAWMTDIQLGLIGAGAGYGGVVAELGAAASATVGGATPIVLNHIVTDQMTQMNFDYILDRNTQIQNGTYHDPSIYIP